ncbi:MAG: hypothetical protein ACKON8_00165, partial [Planctomycetota bacterium]
MVAVVRKLIAGALVACGLVGAGAAAPAAMIGNWDFSTGSLVPAAGMPGMQLAWLPDTPYSAPFGGTPNPPPLVYSTTGSFGVAALGSGSSSTVLRVPDMRGRGAAVGMMATFPVLANGTTTGGAPLTKLNRFSYVADVLVPTASFT